MSGRLTKDQLCRGLLQMLIGKIVFLYCGLRPVSVCGESTRAGDVFFIGSQEETFKLFCWYVNITSLECEAALTSQLWIVLVLALDHSLGQPWGWSMVMGLSIVSTCLFPSFSSPFHPRVMFQFLSLNSNVSGEFIKSVLTFSSALFSFLLNLHKHSSFPPLND